MRMRSKMGISMTRMTRYDDEEQDVEHTEDADAENEQRMMMRKNVCGRCKCVDVTVSCHVQVRMTMLMPMAQFLWSRDSTTKLDEGHARRLI